MPRTLFRVFERLQPNTVGTCQRNLTAGKFMSSLVVGTYPTSQPELPLPGGCLVQGFLTNQDLGRFRNEALFAAFCYLVTKNSSSPTRVESLDLYLYMVEPLGFASATASPPCCTSAISRGWWQVG